MPSTDGRTEKPTPKRRKDARKEGQVARSPEVTTWVGLLVVVAIAPTVVRVAGRRLEGLFALAIEAASHPSVPGDMRVLQSGLRDVLWSTLLPAGVGVGIAVLTNVAQVGVGWSFKAIRPQASRLDPVAGLKRYFAPSGLVEIFKSFAKLAVVGFIGARAITSSFATLGAAPSASLGQLVVRDGARALSTVRLMALGGLVLAGADYAFQRHRHAKSLRMTRQEVKDERREADGDPAVRARIRSRQRAMARRRMMAAVASADALVVNPTHVAVALSYDRSRGGAPRVVAKGADELAARLREEALARGVPVIEDPPLARAIYSACALDAEIPPALYAAVARLLAFVFRLPAVARHYGGVHRMPGGALPSLR